MENGQLDLRAPEKRKTYASLEQKLAIADLLRQRLRKNNYGLYAYEAGWDDAAVAATINGVLPTVNEYHVRNIRHELFGSSRLSSEAVAQMKAKQAEVAKQREAQAEARKHAGGNMTEKTLAAVLARLADIEARLEFAGLALPQDAKK